MAYSPPPDRRFTTIEIAGICLPIHHVEQLRPERMRDDGPMPWPIDQLVPRIEIIVAVDDHDELRPIQQRCSARLNTEATIRTADGKSGSV